MRPLICLLAAALTLTAAPALADNAGKPAHCPPGLAKKNPPCVPPGLAKQAAPATAPEYVVVLDPADYPDWCETQLISAGGVIYRVEPATGQIVEAIAPVEDWAWPWDSVDFAHCPPGLAKKNPPCLPPGQAKKYGLAPLPPGAPRPDDAQLLIDPLACTAEDLAPVVRQGNGFFRLMSDEDKAVLALSLMAALMD